MKKQTNIESGKSANNSIKTKLVRYGNKARVFLQSILLKIKMFYQTRKKFAIVLFGILLMAFSGAIFLLVRNSKSAADSTTFNVSISRGDITETVDVVGNIEAIPSAILTWKTSGIVGEINFKVGDTVKEGEVLAKLMDGSLDSSILNAQNELLAAQLNLEKLINGNLQFQTATQELAAAQGTYKSELTGRNWSIITSASDESIDSARENYYLTRNDFWNAKLIYEELNRQFNSVSSSESDTPANSANSSSSENLSIDQEALDAAYTKMEEAEDLYNKASKTLNKLIGLTYGNNNVVEQSFLEFDVAKAELAEAEVTWRAYRDASPYIVAAEAEVQAIQNTINSSKIIAPFNGTITEIDSSVGETISSGTTAVQVDDLSNLVIAVDVSEVDINKIEVGQDVVITVDAISGKTYQGVVVNVSNAGTNSSGVVRFPVTVKINDPGNEVKPGFTATVSIVINKVSDVLLVPNLAITKLNGQSIVMVDRNGSISPIAIEIGAESDEYTQVISGDINEGDVVVITITSSEANSMMSGGIFRIMGGGGQGVLPRGDMPEPSDEGSNQPTN